MRRPEHHARRHPGGKRLLPTRGAQAPAIAGLQAREADLRDRRAQIVALTLAEGQELRRHFGAHHMGADILGAGLAAAAAVEAAERPDGARLQPFAKDVAILWHGRSLMALPTASKLRTAS